MRSLPTSGRCFDQNNFFPYNRLSLIDRRVSVLICSCPGHLIHETFSIAVANDLVHHFVRSMMIDDDLYGDSHTQNIGMSGFAEL